MNSQNTQKFSNYIYNFHTHPLLGDYKDNMLSILELVEFTDSCEPKEKHPHLKSYEEKVNVAEFKAKVQELCISVLEIEKLEGKKKTKKLEGLKTKIDEIVKCEAYVNCRKTFEKTSSIVSIPKQEESEKLNEKKQLLSEIIRFTFKKKSDDDIYIEVLLSDMTKAYIHQKDINVDMRDLYGIYNDIIHTLLREIKEGENIENIRIRKVKQNQSRGIRYKKEMKYISITFSEKFKEENYL
ncbi:MAG: hypothetical protein PHN31_05640 [Candidatus Gracilibacteria bacterium]|nr:hypothetical protein [Candidatus Gracilibacteria bacterium]